MFLYFMQYVHNVAVYFFLSKKHCLQITLNQQRLTCVTEIYQQEIIAAVNSIMIVLLAYVGGYDRGECLNSVESFDLATNSWSPLKPMLVARGRFAVAEMNGCLYACGGSNGQMDLCCAECYDPNTATWVLLPDMAIQRSYAGSF